MKRFATLLFVAMMSAGSLAMSGCVIAPAHGHYRGHYSHPHRTWVPGHWVRGGHHRYWVRGHWR
jgi:hypothetical protein